MPEKIIKNCCIHCVELSLNCLGCCIAAGISKEKFEDYCDDCITKGECIKKFQNMKDRNVCWTLSDEDKEIYKKQNPAFAKSEEEKLKKEEEKAAEEMSDEEVTRLERMLALRKKNKEGKK